MGARRERLIAALQAALMRAAGEFGEDARVSALAPRALAAAAALDYVLLLASGAAGARIPHGDAERAIRDGLMRGVDELLGAAVAVSAIRTPAANAFARETARTLDELVREEGLGNDERRFALIALANV